jgi:hypothetical protein
MAIIVVESATVRNGNLWALYRDRFSWLELAYVFPGHSDV